MYYSSMNWEIFSKNISVAEFRAHERGLRVADQPRRSVHLQLPRPPAEALFKPAPEAAAACGLTGALAAPGVPLGDPGARTQD